MAAEMRREIPVSAVYRIAGINDDSVWRLLRHYVDETRKDQNLFHLNILGIDEFSVEKHHMYVILLYDIVNSSVIHIAEVKKSDKFRKFIS